MVTGDNDSHGMRGVDEEKGLVYFMANAESPLERHLYSVSFTDASVPMQKITTDSGWHGIAMSGDAHMFLDTFSTPESPPSLTLRSATGRSARRARTQQDRARPSLCALPVGSPANRIRHVVSEGWPDAATIRSSGPKSRAGSPLSCHRGCLRRPRQPACPQGLGRLSARQRRILPPDPGAERLYRIHAGQPRQRIARRRV